MLAHTGLVALVAAVAVATPLSTGGTLHKINYKIPALMAKILAENDDCIMPASFDIRNFHIFSPQDSSKSFLIQFTFNDTDTNINTNCQYNSSSVNVGPPGLTPRWACDNPNVQFIYENGDNSTDSNDPTLTVIEKACPGQNSGMEASGVITGDFTCVTTGSDSTAGAGTACHTKEDSLDVPFSSMQPTPPS